MKTNHRLKFSALVLLSSFFTPFFGWSAEGADRATHGYYLADGSSVPLVWQTNEFTIEMANGQSEQGVAADAAEMANLSAKSIQRTTPGRPLYTFTLDRPVSAKDWQSRAATLRKDPSVRAVYPSFVYPPFGHRAVLTDEIVVRLHPGDSLDGLIKQAAPRRLRAIERDQHLPRVARLRVEGASGFAALEICNSLYETGRVEWAEPNFVIEVRRCFEPNDRYFDWQWHHNNTGQYNTPADVDMDSAEAWNITRGSSDIVIAVLDDGMDIDHPDLRANIFFNTAETPGNGIDDDGNGYVDDINGWDFLYDDNSPRVDNLSDYHATPVAGMIAADINNGIGVTGLAPGCRVLPCRLLGNSDPTVQQVGKAIQYAGLMADVLSMSWTSQPLNTIETSLQFAGTSGRLGLGCPMAASTGNDSYSFRIGFPASLSYVMAIGASNVYDLRSGYSNYAYANGVFVLAPSNDREITNPLGVYSTGSRLNTPYLWFTGTSAAAPSASALCGLILTAEPGFTRQQVEDTVRLSAEKVSPAVAAYDANGYSREYGYGRINANEALLNITPDLAVLSFDFLPDTVPVGGSIAVTGLVRNVGRAINRPVWVEYWLSTSGDFSTRDHLAANSVLIPSLQANEDFSLANSALQIFPAVPEGLYRFGVVVDRPNAVLESAEFNNTLYSFGRLLQVGAGSTDVDLTVRNFDFSPEVIDGGARIALFGQVVNNGSQMSRPVWVEFWLSTDAMGGTFDFYLCDSVITPPLGSGESLDLSTLECRANRATQGLPAGVYRVGVRVDPTADQADTSRANNTFFLLDKWLTVNQRTDARGWRLYQ